MSFVIGMEALRKKTPRTKIKALSGIADRIITKEQMDDRAIEWCGQAGLSDFAEIKDLFPGRAFWNKDPHSSKFVTKALDAVELLDFWPKKKGD